MTPFQAVVLGIVQGLTEFLPVSSSAHLRLIPELLRWKDPGAAFTAVIQWGTFIASVVYFRHDIARLTQAFFLGLWRGRPLDTQDARLAWMILVGTVPIVVLGLLLQGSIKTSFRSMYVIAGALIGLALVLILAEWLAHRRLLRGETGSEMEQISWSQALLIGLAQAMSLVPGSSRSGVTITGGLLVGLTRPTAARYSFLLSLPSVFGAGLHQLIKERRELLSVEGGVINLALATVVSGLVGYAAISFLLYFLRTRTTTIFIVYRLAIGLLLLLLLARGIIPSHPSD
ncbi:MAG: undecaprenyl-diphosphatase UppP [Gemmataceae bacterium]